MKKYIIKLLAIFLLNLIIGLLGYSITQLNDKIQIFFLGILTIALVFYLLLKYIDLAINIIGDAIKLNKK